MTKVTITRQDFLQDRQGRTFADVLKDPQQPLDAVLAFFADKDRQRRMVEAKIHHDRPALAGVVPSWRRNRPSTASFPPNTRGAPSGSAKQWAWWCG